MGTRLTTHCVINKARARYTPDHELKDTALALANYVAETWEKRKLLHPQDNGAVLIISNKCQRTKCTWRFGSPNGTDLRTPNRTPCTGNPPSRCLYQTPAAVGGRDENLDYPRQAPGAPKCARRPCNDTQEIAKSFWSYFYGGMS